MNNKEKELEVFTFFFISRCLQRTRQRDNISSIIFPSCLQDIIINKVNWEKNGIKINDELLSHLVFADDIILIACPPQELEEVRNAIRIVSQPVELSLHLGKTKINKHAKPSSVIVDGKIIVGVNNYVYPGKKT